MTSEACREMRGLLGAAALGRLDPAEEIALRAHLDGCAECRAEQRELAAVASALPLADPDRIAAARAEPSVELGERVLDRVTRQRGVRHARRRTRVLTGAAAAIVAIAAVLVLVFALPSSPAPGRTVVLTASSAGVTGRARLVERPAGTQVAFHVTGLHDGDRYWLWLTGADGHRVAAGTFQGSARTLDMTMTAALPLHAARRIWVTDTNNEVVLDAHLG